MSTLGNHPNPLTQHPIKIQEGLSSARRISASFGARPDGHSEPTLALSSSIPILQTFKRHMLTKKETTGETMNEATKLEAAKQEIIKHDIEKDGTTITVVTNTHEINTAQPSEYWSGRFMALHDRFQAEALRPANIAPLIAAHIGRGLMPGCTASKGPSYLVRSVEQRSTVAMLTDETFRCKRVFMYLESLCITTEAKRSLHAWQQAYARRTGNELLLPQGGCMEDKGWAGRFLGSRLSRRFSIVNI
jgi:hypothetical protein